MDASRQRIISMKSHNIAWEPLKEDILRNSDTYHQLYYQKVVFGGPSLHFHNRALSAHDDDKIEMVYAMLVSWGMHRMGGGATMNDFNIFKDSIIEMADNIAKTKILINEGKYIMDIVKVIFENIKPMKSSKMLVGNSKVLAHYFPSQIAPIDGEYTLQFVLGKGKKNLPTWISEYDFFKQFHENLIFPIINDEAFKQKSEIWMKNKEYIWDTSIPKIIDNLIIGKISQLKNKDRKKNLTTAST